jgi:hypothetical protein
MVIFPASSSFASFATTPTVGKVTPTYAYTNIFGDIPEVLWLILVGKTQISIGQLLNCHLGKLYGQHQCIGQATILQSTGSISGVDYTDLMLSA